MRTDTTTADYYLARNFDDDQRFKISIFNYQYIFDNFRPEIVYDIVAHGVRVWSQTLEDNQYMARITLNRFVGREGALFVELFLNKKFLCVGSFTIVPASLFALEGREAMLISLVQGGKSHFEQIRHATKLMSDVAPRAVFFSILSGIARALGIDHILGVSGENYVNFGPDKQDALARQYDDFFKSLEAVGPVDGFYIVDLRAPKKPVNSVKAGHRIRTRRKRELKENIANAVTASFAQLLSRPGAPAEP